jgi:hypothetical protein
LETLPHGCAKSAQDLAHTGFHGLDDERPHVALLPLNVAAVVSFDFPTSGLEMPSQPAIDD